MLFGFRRLLVLFQLRHHVLHHFGMREEVFFDDGPDFLTLIGGKRLRGRDGGRSER